MILNYRWYFRRKGKKRIRLPDEYGTPEFWAAWRAALERKGGPPSGSLEWLIRRYKESAHFAGLAESSRRSRDNIMQKVVGKSGNVPFANVTKRKIQDGMEARAATPHAANNFLVAMSVLFRWAVQNDHISVNPCDGVEPLRAKIVGHHTWSIEEVEQYRARHPVGTKARLALDLLLFKRAATFGRNPRRQAACAGWGDDDPIGQDRGRSDDPDISRTQGIYRRDRDR